MKPAIERIQVAFIRAAAKDHPDSEVPMWFLFDDAPWHAVISALREPTDDMLSVASRECTPKDNWYAMIDAILAQGKP